VNLSADRHLPGIFAELIDSIIDGEHVAGVLELITRRGVDLLDVTSAGIIVADPRDGYRVLAVSDERANLAELFQSFEGEGPALDVVASREALTVDLASADRRWPRFAPAAREAGVGWVHAHPIRLDSVVVGALNLFRTEAGGDVPDPTLAQALCGLVSVALAQERPARRSERLAERIQQILNERGRVEQAKGILAAHMHISPAEAYDALVHYAQARGTTATLAAHDLIDNRIDANTIIRNRRQREPAPDEMA
jgi:hypothetical protein